MLNRNILLVVSVVSFFLFQPGKGEYEIILWFATGIFAILVFVLKGYFNLSFWMIVLFGWGILLLVMLFGPISLFIVALLSKKRRCIHCREIISKDATRCPKCQGELNPITERTKIPTRTNIAYLTIYMVILYFLSNGEKVVQYFRYQKLKSTPNISEEEAKLRSEIAWDDKDYLDHKERILNLIEADPDHAVGVFLYVISPSDQDLRSRTLVRLESWTRSKKEDLMIFTRAFEEKGYVQIQGNNITFRQVTEDEEAQKLFQETIEFGVRGKTDNTHFPQSLYDFRVKYYPVIQERGMLWGY
ncbi:hypothetical protein A2961_00275 [Candidatus Woesebacteria bacterium RIFCSPLOWO2_01_FULL_39_21]|uniref:Zinc ribbon domain-containing protein n=1 Tax=Candidatus Woesebacteria bacterium RIFCSPLOWO2_01_FULL_39_21 TaxID=1802519 RepID=A0A1F8BJV8_9BACT|nr:MAG: hypothetical protein A2691_02870 [Candidatus Woesebacteria bacterium RIFCSPHIGHO2_01_FULL_39_23]OGM64313.1 MAG: hypothetical protein A2961_00275 [Candidatus Woesebacteria bacterium RIFCSPLOWO2_01_FULL_39_21]